MGAKLLVNPKTNGSIRPLKPKIESSDVELLWHLFCNAIDKEGWQTDWLEVIEDVFLYPGLEAVSRGAPLAPAELSEWLFDYAVRIETLDHDEALIQLHGIVTEALTALYRPAALKDRVDLSRTEGGKIGEKWTVHDLYDAKFCSWEDRAEWAFHFIEEIRNLELPKVIADSLVALVFGGADTAQNDQRELFLVHFWRGDRLVEFHEWGQFVQGYDDLSIPGIGQSRTATLKLALKEYLEKRKHDERK